MDMIDLHSWLFSRGIRMSYPFRRKDTSHVKLTRTPHEWIGAVEGMSIKRQITHVDFPPVRRRAFIGLVGTAFRLNRHRPIPPRRSSTCRRAKQPRTGGCPLATPRRLVPPSHLGTAGLMEAHARTACRAAPPAASGSLERGTRHAGLANDRQQRTGA